jgi:Cytidylate kinase-like family
VPARVVCISRAIGAGGGDVGRIVSERLGFRYVDEEIVAQAAAKGEVDPEVVADAEQRRSLARRMLEDLLWAATPVTPAYSPSAFSAGPQRLLIVEVIRETADRGAAVIVAHAASLALAGEPGLLRVFVTASPEVRAGRLAAVEGVAEAQGAKLVRESDVARASYLKEFYGVSEELPTLYDLVVNTDVLTSSDAAELVVAAAARV